MRKMHIPLLISTLIFQFNAYSGWFNGDDIDYWQENKKIKIENKVENDSETYRGGSIIRSKDNEPFDWNNYEDPSRIEFYDDGGDFVPNRPWREVMKNPTRENVEKYMAWQAKKIELSNNVGKMMASSSNMPIPLVDQQKLNLQTSSTSDEVKNNISSSHNIYWDRLQVTYFYRTACHFCQASKPIVAALKSHHVLFIPVQMDWQKNKPIYSESVNYDDKLASVFPIKGTPTWLIKRSDKPDLEPLTIEGYLSESEMENAIKRLF